jgi:pimeloyl-ACP methyl ester carboxylesterase
MTGPPWEATIELRSSTVAQGHCRARAPPGENGFWDRLSDLKAPTLFIWGDKDWLVPASYERHVADALPAAQSVVLEDCGHVPQYEHAEQTHELTRAFLDRERKRPAKARQTT